MIYPNTQPSGVVGGLGDNKKRLQQLLSQTRAAPLFGGQGRAASVAGLPSAAAPALSFNPFLKMLAAHPGETFDSFSPGSSGSFAAGLTNPLQGFQGSSVQTTSAPPSAGAAPSHGVTGADAVGAPPTPGMPQANTDFSSGYGHYNDTYDPTGGGGPQVGTYGPQATLNPQQQLLSQGINSSNPLYHTLLQLAMYGYDS